MLGLANPTDAPVGLATKLGVIVTALAAVLGPLSTVLDGDQTPEALGALAVAAIAFYKVLDGRYQQAAARSLAPLPTTGPIVPFDEDGALPADEEPPETQGVPSADPHAIPPDKGDPGKAA